MPDITMCEGVGCKCKKSCYRHTAEPSTLQSYANFHNSDVPKCGHYWPNERRSSEKNRSRTSGRKSSVRKLR